MPPFELKYLRRGHAIHFRCRHPDTLRMRVDVMSKMRGVAPFPKLWKRRTTIVLPDGTTCNLLSLPDLVQAKKTQRDKDWPMIRRLVEAHYFEHRDRATTAQIRFWLRELRTPELLIELARKYRPQCHRLASTRAVLTNAAKGDLRRVAQTLLTEETIVREQDRRYWLPLREELQQLRQQRL